MGDAHRRGLVGYSAHRVCKVGDHAYIKSMAGGHTCLQCVHDQTATPISRQDAQDMGYRYFFTGDECVKGHIGPRYVSSGNCVTCAREYLGQGSLGIVLPPVVRPAQLLSRDRAKAQGDLRYYTAVPCRHGHVSERYVKSGTCVTCTAEHRFGVRRPRVLRAPAVSPIWMTRAEAISAGRDRYFTGTPCKWGHVAERVTHNCTCTACLAGVVKAAKVVLPCVEGLTREQARDAGFKRYLGAPCKRGHRGERYVSTNNCITCLHGHY